MNDKRYTFNLYRLPGDGEAASQLWASATVGEDLIPKPSTATCIQLTPWAGSATTAYRVYLHAGVAGPYGGWLTLLASVTIDAMVLGDNLVNVPLTFFDGEPTDMVTGLARFDGRVAWKHTTPTQAPVWMLGIRRSK